MTKEDIWAEGEGLPAPSKKPKKWEGTTPTTCQACGGHFGKFFYDAIIQGQWGMICHACFRDHGCRLGVGSGQKYNTKTLEKVGG